MALARSVLVPVVVLSSLALAVLSGCSGKTIGDDLNTPVDPTDPSPDPKDPADPAPTCPAIAATCDPGDENVGSEAGCKGAEYCYSRTQPCNKSVAWCARRPAQCGAVPTCNAGDAQVTSCPTGNGISCYPRTLCGATILCVQKDACKALPSCNPGDEEVTEVDTCTKPGVSCYSRTACNFTIYCYTP